MQNVAHLLLQLHGSKILIKEFKKNKTVQAEKHPVLQRRHKFGKGPTNNTKNNNLKCKNKCILGEEYYT